MRQIKTRVWRIFRCLPWLFMPAWALALNLGDITLKSEPGEPLEAEISVTGVPADAGDSLSVGLADAEGFRWAGIEWSPTFNRLQFELQRGAGGAQSIRIHTTEVLAIPRLHILLQVAWSRGRLFREYILEFEQMPLVPAARQAEPPAEPDALVVARTQGDDWDDTRAAVREHDNYEVAWGDTLWEIARELRPDGSVTIHQVMLALLRVNPEAFSHDNINWLKAGAVLWRPGEAELQALTAAEAYTEVLAQNNVWRLTRGYPMLDAEPQASPPKLAADVELRLAPVNDENLESDPATAAPDGDASATALAQANREVDELSRENMELVDKLVEAESTISRLTRLVELKDDQLAAMQEQRIHTEAEPGPGLFERLQSLYKTINDVVKSNWRVTLAAFITLLILLGWLSVRRKSAYPRGLAAPAASVPPDFLHALRNAGAHGKQAGPEVTGRQAEAPEVTVPEDAGRQAEAPQVPAQEDGREKDDTKGDEVEEGEDEDQEDEEDQVWNKIELARAYLYLDDTENVRSLLEEVLAEGNAAQRRKARQLLERINPDATGGQT